MKIIAALYFIVPIFLGATADATDDEIIPAGYNFISQYYIDNTTPGIGDTLTITRTFTNNESFAVSGFYFSEHLLPSSIFEIMYHNVLIDGSPIEYLYETKDAGTVIDGYESHYWVLDTPEPLDPYNTTVNPGQTVYLETKIRYHGGENYILPLHTTVFDTDIGAFFATSDTVFIYTESPCGDVDNNDMINILDAVFIISYIYQEGPGPDPVERADIDYDGNINILDITYLLIYLYIDGPRPICP